MFSSGRFFASKTQKFSARLHFSRQPSVDNPPQVWYAEHMT